MLLFLRPLALQTPHLCATRSPAMLRSGRTSALMVSREAWSAFLQLAENPNVHLQGLSAWLIVHISSSTSRR